LTKATVLIPTHDHGPTLLYAAGSALSQSVGDLELFIVGDGVPDKTREIAADLMRRDSRVRFFDNPKGPRHGELHRHAALREATGDIVCYLSDDDLWLANHLETMLALLDAADFANTLPLSVGETGATGGWTIDLALAYYRDLLLSGSNRIPLSCAGHTLEMYRRLPHGWRTTPPDIYTDLYMWQQFLSDRDCRVASGHQPTVLHFPSPWRTEWNIDERVAELAEWSGKLQDDAWARDWIQDVLAFVSRDRARLESSGQENISRLTNENQELSSEVGQLNELNAALQLEVAEQLAANTALRHELDEIHSLPVWRLRAWILNQPFGARLLKWVGTAVAASLTR
jgi:glycosyltransferase involved in cell wall biosynthesis